MGKALDGYRAGYEKGKADTMAENLGEAVRGLVRDDPGGFFAVGYHDGAAGDSFNPPSEEGEEELEKESPGESVG